jgi:hypothetical protein
VGVAMRFPARGDGGGGAGTAGLVGGCSV